MLCSAPAAVFRSPTTDGLSYSDKQDRSNFDQETINSRSVPPPACRESHEAEGEEKSGGGFGDYRQIQEGVVAKLGVAVCDVFQLSDVESCECVGRLK
jgi:hypothetical protein